MAPVIIDNEVKLQALLAHISQRVGKEADQLLFVDLEGVNLSRAGRIAIMQLLMPPSPTVYLVDIHVLGERAFSFVSEDETSLGSILQSPRIYKVFFDIRNNSDALYAHFGISLAGVIDLQVIEYATRNPRGRFFHGLAKCIERDLPFVQGWSITKARGRHLFAPEAGGRYEVFLERPIPKDIVTYCEQDVLLMPRLLAVYGPKLRSDLAAQLSTIVDERIALSKTATFNGTGKHMAIGPHLNKARAHLYTSPSLEMVLVQSARLIDLCRLDASVVEDVISSSSIVHVEQQDTVSFSSEAESTCETTEIPRSESVTTITSITSAEGVGAQEPDQDDYDDYNERTYDTGSDNDSDSSGRDFTACSADSCGYCGRCSY